MAHNIIEGINTVIKGLEMIKVELISKGAQEDLVEKVATLIQGESVEAKSGKVKAEKSVANTSVEADTEEDVEVEETGDRKAELEAMSYNEIKALVSSLGGKAVGNKAKLIDVILELEAKGVEADGEDAENEDAQADEPADEEANTRKGKGNAKESSTKSTKEEVVEEDEEEDEEDDSEEDVEEFREFLNDLSLEEVEEIADELGIDFGVELKKKDRKKVTEKCLADTYKLVAVLEELGYYDEDEEEADSEDEDEDENDSEEVEEVEDIAEELGLNDMDVEELADILAEHDLSTKGKKQALIDRIVKAIEDGTIEIDDEEEEEEPAPKKGGKKGSKK